MNISKLNRIKVLMDENKKSAIEEISTKFELDSNLVKEIIDFYEKTIRNANIMSRVINEFKEEKSTIEEKQTC